MELQGRKEYIQVLRLLENFSQAQVEQAVKQAMELSTIGFDAIKHLILCALERRPVKLDLTLYPSLHRASVKSTDPRSYLSLLQMPEVNQQPMGCIMTDSSIPTTVAQQVLLINHFKTLKLPTFAREGIDYARYLLRLCELECIDRVWRNTERRIRLAKFPVIKSLDTFDFAAIPVLNKTLVLELMRCEWINQRENIIALGPSGVGKIHIALAVRIPSVVYSIHENTVNNEHT